MLLVLDGRLFEISDLLLVRLGMGSYRHLQTLGRSLILILLIAELALPEFVKLLCVE